MATELTKAITVRVSDDDYAFIESRAKDLGLTPSAYCRMVLTADDYPSRQLAVIENYLKEVIRREHIQTNLAFKLRSLDYRNKVLSKKGLSEEEMDREERRYMKHLRKLCLDFLKEIGIGR